MKIELRNIKHLESLSEETNCYTATIYVDGKKAFEASNHGHGGCDLYHPIRGYTGPSVQEIDAWLAANRPADTSYGVTIQHSLEIECGEQVNAFLRDKAWKRISQRIMVITPRGLATYPAKHKPTPENLAAIAKRLKAGEQLVNGNPELEAKAKELV